MRRGASAVELLISSAIMAAAFLPIYALVRSNQQVAFLTEHQAVARRRAYRALGQLEGHLMQDLATHATGAAPPADIPFLPSEGKRLDFELPTGSQDLERRPAPGRTLEGYARLVDQMQTDVFFHELEPGFGRLAALVRWKDPASGAARHFVAVRFVDAPFNQWRAR